MPLGGRGACDAESRRDLLAPTGLHPRIGALGELDHLAHVGIEAEQAVRQPQRIAGVPQGAHAAHQVRAAPAQHHVERRRPVRAEVLAQRVGHRAQRLEDVGVVALAADDEQHVGLPKPMLEADARHRLHLLVRRVAAEVGADDRVVAEHLGHQRIGAAAEGRREHRALVVDHVNVALALMGAQRIDLLLEVRVVGGEQVRRQVQPQPARVVAIEAALEVAGHRREPAVLVRAHANRVQLQRGHAEVVEQLPQLGQLLHQRRDDFLRRADLGQRVGHHERLEAGQRVERHLRHLALVELLDVHAAAMRQGHRRRAKVGRVADREVDLVLGGHAGFEGHAVGLGLDVADLVLGEVQAFLLGQRGLQVLRAAEQAGLALLADAALEYRLDEDQAVLVDQRLDLLLAGVGAEHFGGGEAREFEQTRAVQHSGNLHGLNLLVGIGTASRK